MHQYQIKVRAGGTYIWGGADIEQDTSSNLILLVQVDEVGTPVELETKDVSSDPTLYGTLQPEQIFAIPLLGVRSVKASSASDRDSIVRCVLCWPYADHGMAAAKPGTKQRRQQHLQHQKKKK